MKIGSGKGELNVVSAGGRLKIDNAERNRESLSGLTMDQSGRKRNGREKKKDKNEKVETHDTDEVKRDMSTDWQEGVNVSGKVKGKEVLKEKIKQKVRRTDSEMGEVILEHSESCIASATEIREEMKKDKRRSKDSNFVRSKETHTENKLDEVGLSSKRQESVLYDVEDHTQSTKEDGDTKNNHKMKKKKKHKKNENYKDDLPAAQQKCVDSDTNSVMNTKETQYNEAAELTIKRKKKKTKYLENGSSGERDNEAEYAKKGKRRKTSLAVKSSDDTSLNKSSKKVRFSDQVEVFHLPPKSNAEDGNGEDGLVNTDLQLKLSKEKKSKHRMLMDTNCWGDSDDYRLLSALYRLDANCVEDVDWDDLIDTRAGDVCRKRWNQMVLHIGPNGNKSFAEQVEVLAQRYCPHLLEAREAWDSKPRVP